VFAIVVVVVVVIVVVVVVEVVVVVVVVVVVMVGMKDDDSGCVVSMRQRQGQIRVHYGKAFVTRESGALHPPRSSSRA